MKVLVVGAGAVGGFVGGRLAQAGREVDFLVRPRRAEQLKERGLLIADGGQTDVIDVQTVTAPVTRTYDLVLVSVKAQGLPEAMGDFRGAVGQQTAVVPFLNGIGHIDRLTDAFGRGAVLGGVLKVVTQLDPDGTIRQFAPGGSIEIGELDGTVSDRVAVVSETLSIPGFKVTVTENIMDAMWSKWVFIAVIGALTSIVRGSIGDVTAAVGGVEFAEATLVEAASVAQAAGHPLSRNDYAAVRTVITAAGAATTSSLSRELVAGQLTEVDNVLGDMIARARAAGLPVPRLEAAALLLRAHDARAARTAGGSGE
jgi:2-dehydropantoate 2-reductase